MASSLLGIIGSGMIGGTVAHLAAAADIDVVLSNSRGPDTLAELVGQVGPHARAGTVDEAAAADVVVVAVPLHAYPRLPVAAFSGIVIDAMNYYPERDGRIGALDSGELTSSELVQRQLTGATVVNGANMRQ